MAANEPLRMGGEGSIEHAGTGRMEPLGGTVVDGGRGHQPDSGVAVLVVVPADERSAVSADVLDRVKLGGELGPVVQGFEISTPSRGCRWRCTDGSAFS